MLPRQDKRRILTAGGTRGKQLRSKRCPLRRLLPFRTKVQPISNPSSKSNRVNSPTSRPPPSWNTTHIDSLSSLRSRLAVSSTGVQLSSTQRPFPAESKNALTQQTTYVGSSPTLYERFEELMPGIGSHMEDDLVRLIALAGPERASHGRGILHWQVDMQSRHLPLAALEGRRHTDPAAYPAQRPSAFRSFEKV